MESCAAAGNAVTPSGSRTTWVILLSRLLIEQTPRVAARPAKLWIPVAAYIALSVLLYPQYRYVIGSDGISYISVARHYLAGDWHDAVNLYWGPLYSWLLAIPLALGASGVTATRVVCFAAGLLALCAFARLIALFELSPFVSRLCLWIAAAMIFAFSLRDEPDLLIAAFLLLYFGWIFDARYSGRARAGLLCGLFGGLAFLTKSYGFVFFAGHFTLMNAVHSTRSPRRAVLRNFALGCAVFAALAAPWIAAISHKYGHPTIGTTGAFNLRLEGPQSPDYPQYQRLLDPPNPRALSFWEDPPLDSLPAWSPLSRAGLGYEARLAAANLKDLSVIWLESSILSIALLLAYALWGMSAPPKRVYWPLPVLTILTYPLGYLLITVVERYMWPATLLFVLAGGTVVEAALRSGRMSSAARKTLAAAFAISFLLLPARNAIGQYNDGRASYQLSREIHTRFPLHGNLAACGNWNDSLYLAYYLDLPFLGDTTAAEDLARHNADYYLAWNTCSSIPPSVAAREDITRGTLGALKIYLLK